MPIIRRATAQDVSETVQKIVAESSNGLLLFFGSENLDTGESWCPDCVTADPVMRSAATSLRPDLTLYECPVGMRLDWKNKPEHPYRTHHLLRVQRIPTLIYFEKGCERSRLVEADCARQELVAAFLRK
jgi:hypothetical protein